MNSGTPKCRLPALLSSTDNSFGQALLGVGPACARVVGDWLHEEQLTRGTTGSGTFQNHPRGEWGARSLGIATISG